MNGSDLFKILMQKNGVAISEEQSIRLANFIAGMISVHEFIKKERDDLRAKLAESAAEIKRLESAWHVETMSRKDRIIGDQEAENDRLRAKLAALESQEPAGKITKWLNSNTAICSGEGFAAADIYAEIYFRPVPADKPAVAVPDRFNGDDKKLVECAAALLNLDAKGALTPHGLGGHARTIIESFVSRSDSPHSKKSADSSESLREIIEREADRFFDWPSADKSHVTAVSTKLFAGHIATLYASPDRCPSHESEGE